MHFCILHSNHAKMTININRECNKSVLKWINLNNILMVTSHKTISHRHKCRIEYSISKYVIFFKEKTTHSGIYNIIHCGTLYTNLAWNLTDRVFFRYLFFLTTFAPFSEPVFRPYSTLSLWIIPCNITQLLVYSNPL